MSFLSQSGNTNWVIDGSIGVSGPDFGDSDVGARSSANTERI